VYNQKKTTLITRYLVWYV